jgi:hypothetical protein
MAAAVARLQKLFAHHHARAYAMDGGGGGEGGGGGGDGGGGESEQPTAACVVDLRQNATVEMIMSMGSSSSSVPAGPVAAGGGGSASDAPLLPGYPFAPAPAPACDSSASQPPGESFHLRGSRRGGLEGEGEGGVGGGEAEVGRSALSGLSLVEQAFRRRATSARELHPYYMLRQPEISPTMRRILINWLVELYDELELQMETLLQAVFHVDRYLSANAVRKEELQLVGAVALMLASNNFCRLPHQEGSPPEHGLNHAEDIVYWTDGTYSMREVLEMEARLMAGFELGEHQSSQHFLCLACAGSGLPEPVVSIAAEVLCVFAREYELLCLHPRLLAACALYVAVRNSHDGHREVSWSDRLADRCGYSTEEIAEHVNDNCSFLDGCELTCRRLGATPRARTLGVTLSLMSAAWRQGPMRS